MNKRTILMSPADSNLYEYFEKQFTVINSECLSDLISYERYHADMQALKIKEKLFVNGNCSELIIILEKQNIDFTLCDNIGTNYPDNIALNAALVGNKLLCLEIGLHPTVKDFCYKSGIKIINVKQGYTKCSTLIINENSIITDDISIQKASLKEDIDVLLVEKGDIYLNETNYGFIGGASTVIGDTVYFFGDINRHRNANKILEYLDKKNMKVECINKYQLKDIGGIITLD